MRLRTSIAAFVLFLALLLAATTTSNSERVTASARPIAMTVRSADERMMADHHTKNVALWNDAVADNQARLQAEQDARDAARAAAAAKHPSAPASTVEDDSPAAVGSGDAETAVRAHFGDIFNQAWGVSGCESGHDPGIVSPGGGNWGLFQINTVHKADFVQFANALLDDQHATANDPRRTWEGGVLNADLNAAYARKLYNGEGWGPWECAWAAYS